MGLQQHNISMKNNYDPYNQMNQNFNNHPTGTTLNNPSKNIEI